MSTSASGQVARASRVRGVVCLMVAAADALTVGVLVGAGPFSGATAWPTAVWAVAAGVGSVLALALAAVNLSRRDVGGGATLLVALSVVHLVGAEVLLLVRAGDWAVTAPVAIVVLLQTGLGVLLALWTRHGVGQRATAR